MILLPSFMKIRQFVWSYEGQKRQTSWHMTPVSKCPRFSLQQLKILDCVQWYTTRAS